METTNQTSSATRGGFALAVFLTVMAGLAPGGFSQTLPQTWRWSNPGPHGGNVFDMAYGLGVTIQVCERGQIYTSDDLVSWTPRASGTTKSLRAVTFLGQRVIITGEAGTVLYADSLEDFERVDLSTTDWLEGVAASDSKVVAVGDNAAIYVSSDGVTWAKQTAPGGATNWLRGVAFGGNNFVAVGEGGFIATANASNPSTWTQQTSSTSSNLNRVAYLNGTFWIVGDGGVTLTNSNPTLKNWALVSSGATNALYAVTGTSAARLLVGDKEVRLTDDGSTWSSQTDPGRTMPARPWTYYSGLWEDSLYLIAGRSGMTYEGFKTNGTETFWVTRHDPIRTWLWDVVRTTNFYVAVGDYATILTSERGINWQLELVPDAATNSILLGVGGTTNGLVAVGNKGTLLYSPNLLTNVVFTNLDSSTVTSMVSTVGTLWHAVEPRPTTNDLQGVALRDDLFVVAGGGGTILTSTDGTNWTLRPTPVTKFLSSVEAFPGGWVVSGDGGTVLTSLDGVVWLPAISGTTNWIYRVRYLNGQLIGVGENGTILTSASGVLWTERTSGTTNWLNDVEFVANTYFVAGNQGTVLASVNGVTWTNVGTITQKSLFGLASNDGQLLAVGVEGAIVRSQLTPLNLPFRFVNFGRVADQHLFLVAGHTDQRITFDSTTNLVDWTEGITLEILDPSGSLLFLEKADTNNLPRQFFRGRLAQ